MTLARSAALASQQLFLPNVIPNLQAWYSSNTLSPGNENGITTWQDSSGFLRHVTSNLGNPFTTNTNTLNGRLGVQFNGNAGMATAAFDPGITSESTAFVVARKLANVAYGMMLTLGGPSPDYDVRFNVDGLNADFARSGSTIGPAPGLNVGFIMSARESSSVSEVSINGARTTRSATSLSVGSVPLRLGRRSETGSYLFNGVIYEALVYNRRLTDSEMSQVERFLSTRYGVAVSS